VKKKNLIGLKLLKMTLKVWKSKSFIGKIFQKMKEGIAKSETFIKIKGKFNRYTR